MEPNISYWQLEKEYYAVSVTPDLAIRIIEHELITRAEGNGSITENIPYKVHEFKVSGAVLAFASAMLNGLLARSPPNITTVDVHEKDGSGMIQGLKFWFELLHGLFNDDMQSLKLIDVWNVIATAHKYGFNTRGQAAKNWFDGWYKAQFQINKFGFKEYEQLLYPTYVFDHAYGFAQTTKNLCYRAHGTINQKQPASFDVGNKRDLYLDENVLIQLNSAKGRLQIILHRALYAPIDTLLKSGKCACKANALYAYESSLNSTHVWPMESKMHNTGINSIIKSLDTFQPSKTFQPQTCGSKVCTIDCKDVILTASQDCKKYFDGMCLDCMSASDPRIGNSDELYWNHTKTGVPWDQGCRISHGQPSWYSSFLGSRQKMQDWVRRPRNGNNHHGQAGRYSFGPAEFVSKDRMVQ